MIGLIIAIIGAIIITSSILLYEKKHKASMINIMDAMGVDSVRLEEIKAQKILDKHACFSGIGLLIMLIGFAFLLFSSF